MEKVKTAFKKKSTWLCVAAIGYGIYTGDLVTAFSAATELLA